MQGAPLTGRERFFDRDEVIVTKTDLGGRITYANDVFLRISSLTEASALGEPHNIIRHPRMPAAVFRLLWETVQGGKEIFAYVLNRATNGDHYWVFAHVTPSFEASGAMTGYHSNRRVPDRQILERTVMPLYDAMLEAESAAPSSGKGIEASLGILTNALRERNQDYEEFIFSLQA